MEDETPASDVSEERRSPVGHRALGATWRLLILVVAVAAIAVTLAQSLRVYFYQADEIASLRVEIQARQQEISQLNDQLKRWDDPKYVRAEARTRLGWVMRGETGYRVIGADGKPIGGDSNVLRVGEDDAAGTAWFDRMWGSVVVADQPVPTEAPAPAPDVTIGPSPEPSPTR